MWDNHPPLTFQLIIRGRGELSRGKKTVSLDSCTIERSKYSHAKSWKFAGHVSEADEKHLYNVLNNGSEGLRFQGVTTGGTSISLKDFRGWHREGRFISGSVREIDLNVFRIEGKPEHQYIEIYLTPTDLALPSRNCFIPYPTGEVKGNGKLKKPLLWNADIGQFKLAEQYTYEWAEVEMRESRVQIPRDTLIHERESNNPILDIAASFDSLAEELSLVTKLLGFLGRNKVDWFGIKIFTVLEKQEISRRYHEAERMRTAKWFERTAEYDELVNPHWLTPGSLNRMYRKLLELPFRSALELSTLYLQESRQAGYLESNTLNAFIALETLVNGICEAEGTDRTLDTVAFRCLRKSLETSIKEYCESKEVSNDVRFSLCSALTALQHRPLIPRLLKLIRDYDVELDDIWGKKVELEESLQAIFARRGTLVHGGRLAADVTSIATLYRVQAITERLIYRMLGGEDKWISPSANTHFNFL